LRKKFQKAVTRARISAHLINK